MSLRKRVAGGEEVLVLSRRHVGTLLRPLLLVALVAAAGIFAGRAFDFGEFRAQARIVAVAILALATLRLLWRILVWRSRVYMITPTRLVIASGVLRRSISAFPLASIAELSYRKSLFGKLLGYGDIRVVTTGRKLRMIDVARPKSFVTTGLEARQGALAPRAAPRPAPAPSPPLAAPLAANRPPHEPAAGPVVARAPVPGGDLIDGRYLLQRRIALGGMGRVYAGVDERLGRPVAIKLLREELAGDPHFIERFRREARAAAGLNHPNVASVFDYGESSGISFIVMELVAGEDLAVMMDRQGPLSVERAAAVAREVLEALDHAHGHGVIHRDIKPGNVIVREDEHVKVTDFGIARAVGTSRMTATDSVLGSVHYMSPEQVSGAEITPAADIYSVGVLIYEMLTGTPPFDCDSPLEIAQRHVSHGVPLPSDADPSVSDELDEVVYKATERDPERRYASARAMAEALAPAPDPEPRRRSSRRITRRLQEDDIDTPPLRA